MASASQGGSDMAGRISITDFAILIQNVPFANLPIILEHYKNNRAQIADEEYEQIMRIIGEAMEGSKRTSAAKPTVANRTTSRNQVEKFRINPLQWERIKKRKAQREAYEKKHNLNRGRVRVNYKTRQDHAKRRPRGKGGRFLTKEEIEAEISKGEESTAASQTTS